MGDSVCLQPWVSISGNANTVIQDESTWVDIGGYQGVVIYAEVAFVNSQASQTNLDIQTAPTRDEAFFGATFSGGGAWIATFPFTTAPPIGVQALAVRRWSDSTTATTQPQSLVRWRIRFGASDTDLTFRVWLNLLRTARGPSPGLRMPGAARDGTLHDDDDGHRSTTAVRRR